MSRLTSIVPLRPVLAAALLLGAAPDLFAATGDDSPADDKPGNGAYASQAAVALGVPAADHADKKKPKRSASGDKPAEGQVDDGKRPDAGQNGHRPGDRNDAIPVQPRPVQPRPVQPGAPSTSGDAWRGDRTAPTGPSRPTGPSSTGPFQPGNRAGLPSVNRPAGERSTGDRPSSSSRSTDGDTAPTRSTDDATRPANPSWRGDTPRADSPSAEVGRQRVPDREHAAAAGPASNGEHPSGDRAAPGAHKAGPPDSRSTITRRGLDEKRAPAVDHTQATRPYDQRGHEPGPGLSRSQDHRYARPDAHHLRPYPKAPHPPPRAGWYGPRYAHWWVHPYYRNVHATTTMVSFSFVVAPWGPGWAPPPRPGWAWVGGYWWYDWWWPGYWRPLYVAPVVIIHNHHVHYVNYDAYYDTWYDGSYDAGYRDGYDAAASADAGDDGCSWDGSTWQGCGDAKEMQYVYVPGWWYGELYIEGFWRVAERPEGDWIWVDGSYMDDSTFEPGYWMPAGSAPDGYQWEPGFFDGDAWVEGFWRPLARDRYQWITWWYDDNGVRYGGYWEPLESRPGQVWIPGWFDGNEWIQGYWVSEADYASSDPATWQPEEGWDAGWDEPAQPVTTAGAGDLPLALPVLEGSEPPAQ